MTPRRKLRAYLGLLNPAFLAAGAGFYATGLSALDYLGLPLDPGRAVLGGLLVWSVQLTASFARMHFNAIAAQAAGRETPDPAGLPAKATLYAAIVAGGLTAILGSGMAVQGSASLTAWLLFGLGCLLAVAYSVPPMRLETSGYGELALSLGLAGFIPSFAYALQTGELQRLVWLATAPLVSLTFASLLAHRLRSYGADVQREHRTLLVRLGWETGMRMHDGAIVFAAVLLAAGIAGGLPQPIGWGGLIALPLAAAQIWQMRRIRAGLPPRWRHLTVGAVTLVCLMVYFTLLGFVAG
jgi:1,4-dihydroxy-2-naphthoate octaprenyltransferase